MTVARAPARDSQAEHHLKVFRLKPLAADSIVLPSACRRSQSNVFVIALSDNLKTIDPIGSPSVDAASERVRTLMFNSLVKKDEKFDYVPELAQTFNVGRRLVFTFTMRDGVSFTMDVRLLQPTRSTRSTRC